VFRKLWAEKAKLRLSGARQWLLDDRCKVLYGNRQRISIRTSKTFDGIVSELFSNNGVTGTIMINMASHLTTMMVNFLEAFVVIIAFPLAMALAMFAASLRGTKPASVPWAPSGLKGGLAAVHSVLAACWNMSGVLSSAKRTASHHRTKCQERH
jgi:hypothetical protein